MLEFQYFSRLDDEDIKHASVELRLTLFKI